MNRFEQISEQQFQKDFLGFDIIQNQIKLPQRATEFSAGYDFYAPYDIEIKPKCAMKVPTGIRIKLDKDKFLALYPRSGLGFKYKMQLFNSTGIIDSDYYNSDNEGHIWCKFYNDDPEGKTIIIKRGEAMCQGIIQQYFKTDDDNAAGTRNGGFGSTNI